MKKVVIFIVAAVLGLVNAAVIFNITHQDDYVVEAILVVSAMSQATQTIVVNNDKDFQNFSEHAANFKVYLAENVPETVEKVWYILTDNSPNPNESPDNLIPGFYIVSEVSRSGYTAYELEKL